MMPSYFVRYGVAIGTCMILLPWSAAWAGYSVEVSVNGGAPAIYPDNGPDDLNPAQFDIEIDFMVNDLGNNWTASGTVLATGGGDGALPVSTILTDTLIEKVLPGLFNGTIEVVHNYAASGLQLHSAHIDGQFENTQGNPISYAELFYTPTVMGQGMGTAHEGPVINALGPIPFDHDLGPLQTVTTIEHEIRLDFYLDSPGDAIRLFNSAELHTVVPEPSMAMLGLATAGLAALIRRRSA